MDDRIKIKSFFIRRNFNLFVKLAEKYLKIQFFS